MWYLLLHSFTWQLIMDSNGTLYGECAMQLHQELVEVHLVYYIITGHMSTIMHMLLLMKGRELMFHSTYCTFLLLYILK